MTNPTGRMTVSDIADFAEVERATVSNWQRRYRDDSLRPFPSPLPDSPSGRPQFDAEAVQAWVLQHKPELQDREQGPGLVRRWRYTVSGVSCDDATDPLVILVAAARGETIDYDDSDDQRHPVAITAAEPGVTIYASREQAEVIREFLSNEVDDPNTADIIAAAIDDYDSLNRWRRNKRADQAEENLHALFRELLPDGSQPILDFACGTGSLLAAVNHDRPQSPIVGIEPTRVGCYIAQARFDHRPASSIEQGDILENDTLDGRTFKVVVSIPPAGRRVDPADERMRRLPFGAVRGTADAAWPQLAAQAMTPDGEAFLVLPHNLASSDRADDVRRALIQQGLVAAIITLPPNAHPASKTLSDLWVLSARRDDTREVLFVDYSTADPSQTGVYTELADTVSQCLEPDNEVEVPDDPRYAAVVPMKLLGPTVNLDPLYWTVRATTPASAPDLIAAVTEASTALTQARDDLLAQDLPSWALSADRRELTTVGYALKKRWLQIIRRTASARDGELQPPDLRIEDAELMWRGENKRVHSTESLMTGDSLANPELVQPGDVLVWATSDRQIRATVSNVGGYLASYELIVLRCDPDRLDPYYLALTLANGRNILHVTSAAVPGIRSLELSFPMVHLEKQRQFAQYADAAQHIMAAAHHVAAAAAALRQTLADAAGSGAVGTTTSERSAHDER